MTLLLNSNKGPYMNNLAQFYVQQYSFPNKLIAEKYFGEGNPLF